MSTRGLHFRPARSEDSKNLAYLLVQLYDSELPGVICGSLDNKVDFIYNGLLNGGFGGTSSHYLVYDNENLLIGTAALRLPSDDKLQLMPRNVFKIALMTLGVVNAVKMLYHLPQATAFLKASKIPSNAAYIHSVVVEQKYRKNGFGSVIISGLENIALENNITRLCLHVLSANIDARKFYLKCGYCYTGGKSRWWSSSVFSSDMFCKLL